jgi:hypothetical protein
MIIRNTATATAGTGVDITASSGSRFINNLVMGFFVGISYNQYVYANLIANNTVVKCPSRGFYTASGATSSIMGYHYNNISVGNGTNWNSIPTSAFDNASHNVGVIGDTAWVKSGGSTVLVNANWNSTTPLFMDYANNDFRPYASGGVLNANSTLIVDSGLGYYGLPSDDIAGDERPNYNNGGAESTDIGAYEYDHGYGPRPASTTVTFSGVVPGSEIHVYDDTETELTGVESCSANHQLTWNIPPNPTVSVTLIKRGIRPQKFPYLSSVGDKTIPLFPQPDLGYNNPA